MVDAKDPLVNDVLNKIKTRELTIFENKLQGQIDILEADKKMFLSNSSADKIARKSIQRQIDDLKVVKDMSSTMNKQELDAFQSLMEIFKTKSHVM